MSTADMTNIISDQNFQEITDLSGFQTGQRIIRVGERMFPVGFGSRSSDAAESSLGFAVIAHYNPYAAAYQTVTAVEVSGFGTYSETDYSIANGTYSVTEATAGESDQTKRVYQNGEYYFYFYSEMGDPIYGKWYIGKTIGSSYTDVLAYMEEMSQTPPSGTKTWYENISWNSIQITTNLTEVTVPEVPERLEAAEATDYDPELGQWTTGSAVVITSFEETPVTDDIFAVKDTMLIGRALGNRYPLVVPVLPSGDIYGDWMCESDTALDNNPAYKAFGEDGEYWHSRVTNEANWLMWRNSKYKFCIRQYTIKNRSDGSGQSLEWKLQGSNDGVEWTDLDHVVLTEAAQGSVYSREIPENTRFFRMHRFYSIKNNHDHTSVEDLTARGVKQPDDMSDVTVKYIISGAGSPEANGAYWATGKNNYAGYPVYTNGICFFSQVYASTSQAWDAYWKVYKRRDSGNYDRFETNIVDNMNCLYTYYPSGGSAGDNFWEYGGMEPYPEMTVL